MAVICPANQGCGGLRAIRIEDIRSSLAKCARHPDLEENGITFERCQSRVSDGRVRQRRHSPSACRRPIGYPAWRRAGAGRLSHSGILLPRRTIRQQHAVNRLGGDGHVAGSGCDGPAAGAPFLAAAPESAPVPCGAPLALPPPFVPLVLGWEDLPAVGPLMVPGPLIDAAPPAGEIDCRWWANLLVVHV
jgi:hypothetical protein